MQYDIIIIGSGPGGYVAAIRASQLGLKTAIVEKSELGGVCLNWGCIPTKALLKSAQVYNYIEHASEYGIDVEKFQSDFPRIIKRSRDVASGMSKGVGFLMKKNKIDIIKGYGKLTPDKKVEVTAEDGSKNQYQASHIILATGARPRELPNIPIDGEKIVGYNTAMVLPTQPKSMVVVGSGAIGCEFAYFYSSLGTQVTIVEFMPQILPLEDEEISKALARSFKKNGITIKTESTVESVEKSVTGCNVRIKSKTGEEFIQCDVVLSAVGITTNIENLGLESAGIKFDKGKIHVDEFYKTNVPGIYAIGDIVPGPALAHVASHEGIICVEKIAGHNPKTLDYGNIPSCTYCWPEVASVGLTEKQARDAGLDIKVGRFPFSASGKASAAGIKDGLVKVIFDAKYGEWLGCHMVGGNVTEMIAEAVVARDLETTGHDILRAIHPHPTMSEAIMEATADAYGECIHL